MGPCQSCGMQFRLLADGTIRSRGQRDGGRCNGSRLAPASTHSPVLDGFITPTDEGADTAP